MIETQTEQPIKEIGFAEWSVIITSLLGLEKDDVLFVSSTNGNSHSITVADFFANSYCHKEWQPIIIKNCDQICADQMLYHQVITEEDVATTKESVIKYLISFIKKAINTGYNF